MFIIIKVTAGGIRPKRVVISRQGQPILDSGGYPKTINCINVPRSVVTCDCSRAVWKQGKSNKSRQPGETHFCNWFMRRFLSGWDIPGQPFSSEDIIFSLYNCCCTKFCMCHLFIPHPNFTELYPTVAGPGGTQSALYWFILPTLNAATWQLTLKKQASRLP